MTAKPKKTKRRKARPRHGKGIEPRASVEDDLLLLAEEGGRKGALEWSTQAEDLVPRGY